MVNGMQSTQIAVRLPDALLRKVDALVEAGEADSRADAVRTALERLIRIAESQKVGRQIAVGYERQPVGEPDEWGSLDQLADWGAAAVLADLDRQERDAGIDGW
jgi:Arc/MetJ-type ribon-helix-helix transcriptional regulator